MIIDTRKPREKWFIPPGVREKLEKDKIIRLPDNVSDYSVIDAILNLSENETMIIPSSYTIIPKELKRVGKPPIENPKPTQFKRYGENIPLLGIKSRKAAIKLGFNPQEELKKSLNQIGMSKTYRGYGWWGITRQKTTHKHVPPTSLLDGYGMYVFFEKIGEDLYKKLGIPREGIIIRELGTSAEILVPSRSRPGLDHSVIFDMLPIKNLQEGVCYADWSEFRSSETGIEDKRYRERGQRYTVPEVVFVDHDVAAYAALLDCKSKTLEPIRINPFAVPTEEGVLFDDNLTSGVVIEGVRYRRNPNEAERDIMNLKFSGYCNIVALASEELPAYGRVFKGNLAGIENYMVKIK